MPTFDPTMHCICVAPACPNVHCADHAGEIAIRFCPITKRARDLQVAMTSAASVPATISRNQIVIPDEPINV